MSPVPRGSTRVQLARALFFRVPLCSQARGLRRPSSSWWTRLSRAPTLRPQPTLREGVGVALGAPLPPVHSPSHPSAASRVHHVGLKTRELRWHVPRGPVHSVGLPSAGRGSPPPVAPLATFCSIAPVCCPWSSSRRLRWQALWLASQGREAQGAACPVGLGVLQVRHRPLSPRPPPSWRLPCSAWPLCGACGSPQSVVDGFAPKAHRVPVYPKVFLPHSDMITFTAHGADAVGSQVQCFVRAPYARFCACPAS